MAQHTGPNICLLINSINSLSAHFILGTVLGTANTVIMNPDLCPHDAYRLKGCVLI